MPSVLLKPTPMQPRKILGLVACALLTLNIAACGGGSDGAAGAPALPAAPNSPVTYKIGGTVAYGQPVGGQVVQVKDSTGTVCASATTAADGSYAADTTRCAPGSAAVSLQNYTTPAGAPLVAVAVPPQGSSVISGVVNIDPLTTLISYAAAGLVTDAAVLVGNAQVLALLPKVTPAQYQQARTSVLIAPLLQRLRSDHGVDTSTFDPGTTPFVADGRGIDGFFDAYPLTATPTSVQLQAPGSIGPLVRVTLPVTPGSGAVVTSTTAYNIGGTTTGLTAGDSIVLLLNGGNAFTVVANGNFTFPTPVASTYAVTVGSQPTGKTCTVSNGSGAGIAASVSNIAVTCSALTYKVGGSVFGLTGTLTLLNNGADAKTVNANGAFVFAAPVAWHGGSNVTVGTQPSGQTCTVTNGLQLNIAADVSNINILCATHTYTIGGTVSGLSGTLTLQNNGADSLVLNADGAFVFATPVALSSGYSVTVSAQPAGKTCTVGNGSGANVTANVTNVGITCATTPQPVFIYVPDYGNNQVLGYRLDTNTGTFETISGGPFAAGSDPRWVSTATTPGGTFLYATNQATNDVSGYRVNMSTGALTPLSGSPFAAGAQPGAITIHPAGTFAYVANQQGGSVSGYAIDQANGALTPVTGSPFAAGAIPIRIAMNPAGTFAYVANQNGGNVSGYRIDQTSGALTPLAGSPFANTGSPRSVTVHPGGAFAYVANDEASISGFNIDPGTGALTPMAGSPFAGADPTFGWRAIAVNPAGTYAYASAGENGPLLVFGIDPGTGVLTSLPANTFQANTGDGPLYTTFDATGDLAYVGNFITITLALTRVNPLTGALTPLFGSPYNIGARPYNLAVVKP